ncbi:nucleobase-ascorbate transporter 11 isoform X2 [Jatropha curcas]|uniref:nucleobase-ascorbate transporter 11 isoform X2 n=1 Tax=Jatropha curcas TaxID=180498 RepID=UPI0005FBB03A|nr:nucleobase-ascorbate transporter 11 isoform X2 [Jatropha curcas]
METGSSSNPVDKSGTQRERAKTNTNLGSMLPKIEPFVARTDHNPRELRSWAKRTGFISTFSSETTTSNSGKFDSSTGFDLEKGVHHHKNGGSSPKIEIDPVLGRTRTARGSEIEADSGSASRTGNGLRNGNDRSLGLRDENKRRRIGDESVLGVKGEERKFGLDGNGNVNGNGNRNGSVNGTGNEVPAAIPALEPKKEEENALTDTGFEIYQDGDDSASGGWHRRSGMKFGLRDNPGFVPLMYYGLQHYLSLAGSLIFIPLIIVPAMGGTDKDTATVISTMLLISGITTILHSYFEIQTHNEGAPGGYNCWFNIPSHLGIHWFNVSSSKYLRGLSIFGHRLFRVYAVPLSVMIIWTYAFFLTAGGAYNYKGCSPDIPSSNILVDACRRHAYTMQHCRTDVSNALRTSAWVRIPYPLQWGIPIFHLRTSLIMIIVSLVASVDSVGTYHSTSFLVNSKPPTPGIVSRGIALEGFCSLLAGLWGSGTGSTTLTENVHTINITKVASRRAVVLGAVFLILFSFVGKVGAILASIPLALAASVLCFMWGLIVALGLSTLQYSQTASFRNIAIVGVSLFLGLSIPAYFQQYQPESSLILPSYFVPFAAASNGPVHTSSKQFDFAINALMSLNMVVTFLIAFVLDNTVPGTRQERGVYIWSHPEDLVTDPSLHADYSLPQKVSRFFCWSRCSHT